MKLTVYFVIFILVAGLVAGLSPAEQKQGQQVDDINNKLGARNDPYANGMKGTCSAIQMHLAAIKKLEDQIKKIDEDIAKLTDQLNRIKQGYEDLEQQEKHAIEETQRLQQQLQNEQDPQRRQQLQQMIDDTQNHLKNVIKPNLVKMALDMANLQKDIDGLKAQKAQLEDQIAKAKKDFADKQKTTNPKRIIAWAIDPNDPNHIIACSNHPNCSFPPGSDVKIMLPRN